MTSDDNRLYYMGSRGRHRNWRESGLGLAYVDKNKFVALVARNHTQEMIFSINPLKFHGEQLEVWVDIAENGYMQFSLKDKIGFEAENAQLEKKENGAYLLSWKGQSLIAVSKNEKLGVILQIVGKNSAFWGFSGEFEMDQRRYWRS